MMHIRLLTAQDGPAYQQLRLEALQTNPQAFLSTYDTEATRHEAAFSQELDFAYAPPHFGFYGLFEDELLVAFCQVGKSYLEKQNHIAFLYNLYVSIQHRQRGYGKQLMQHVITTLTPHEHLERLFLTCTASNKPARKFYQALGFGRCGIRPRSVKWGGSYDDEIDYCLLLKPTASPTPINN